MLLFFFNLFALVTDMVYEKNRLNRGKLSHDLRAENECVLINKSLPLKQDINSLVTLTHLMNALLIRLKCT